MTTLPEAVYRAVYAYGSLETGRFGYLILRRDGLVEHYQDFNERNFVVEDGTLSFYDGDGLRTNGLFRYNSDLGAFFSADRYLTPALRLPVVAGSALPRVFVNSIPKSGTYLFEALFRELGFTSIGLHLSDDFFDDNRNLAADKYHAAPHLRRTQCPATAIAALLQPGEFTVGHLASVRQLSKIQETCVVLQLVRNLRSVLVSMYRFKQERVEALDAADILWRSLPERSRFHGFLVHSHTRDTPFIASVANGILNSNAGMIVKYEDTLDSSKAADACENISRLLNLICPDVTKGLQEALFSPTSTLSSSPTDDTAVERLWDDDIEAYFHCSGLFALNKRLGYEPD